MYKQVIIRLMYMFLYRNKNVKFGKKCSILGKDTIFEGYNRIGDGSLFSGSIGVGSYIGQNSRINATIGRYCCISDRVNVLSGTHPTKEFVTIHPAFFSTKKQCGISYVEEECFDELLLNPVDGKTSVYIGNDVWIGADVTIIGGVSIGDGAIIAAGSVVNHNVSPYTIVGGVPARIIRKRFTDDQISFLKEFCWWEKDTNWLQQNHRDFRNIEQFVERHGK